MVVGQVYTCTHVKFEFSGDSLVMKEDLKSNYI